MRRTQKPLHTIKAFQPLFFWQKCDICHEEFKKEIAWKIKFPTTRKIICIKCAQTLSKAEVLALTWGEKGTDRPSLVLTRMVDEAPRPPKVAPGIKQRGCRPGMEEAIESFRESYGRYKDE